MKKIIKDNYEIEFSDCENYDEAELNKIIDKSLRIIKHKEAKDEAQKDTKEPRLVHSNGKLVEKGDEVIDFRGDKAIVEEWQAPAVQGKSGRVYVKEILKNGETFEAGYYPEVYGLKWINLPWQKMEDVYIEDK